MDIVLAGGLGSGSHVDLSFPAGKFGQEGLYALGLLGGEIVQFAKILLQIEEHRSDFGGIGILVFLSRDGLIDE
jgi:hypothetical protein